MTVSLCKLFQYFLRQNRKDVINEAEKGNTIDENKLEHLFCMCAVWCFGGALTIKDNTNYRKEFSDFWKNKFKRVKFPSTGLVFDYFVILEGLKPTFDVWKNKLTEYTYDGSVPMKNITVPIPETLSIKNITKNLLLMNHASLYIGNSGSGKTQLIKGLLQEIRKENPEDYYYSTINFNYYTDSDYLQTMLE
jgi:dynein heavy chain, axonemal